MKNLQEALTNFTRLNDGPSDDELDFDLDGETAGSTDDVRTDFDLEDGEVTAPDDKDLDNVATQASEDPNRRGLIRTVKDCHLVYKREAEDGTFEELWVFNISDLQKEIKTRRAILAGTDIPANNTKSPDGKQEYYIWTAGNMEMLKITGLPS